MMKPLLDIDQAYNLILQEEKQRSLSVMSQINSGAFVFNSSLHNNSIDHSAFVARQRSYISGT